MGVLIKDMEMPTRCAECRLSTVHNFKERPLCDVLVEYMSYGEWEVKRLDNCPLVPVPPHGRLIEESKVLDIVSEWCPDDDGSVGKDGDLREMLDEIEAIPTIIQADPPKEET